MKEEDNEEEAEAFTEEEYGDEVDFVVQESPYEMERDIQGESPAVDEDAGSGASFSDPATPEDSAFYQYPKHVDHAVGSIDA